MRFKNHPDANVVKCGQKEQIAKEFIQNYMEQPAGPIADGAPATFLLLARSPESPIAAALAALSADIAAAGIAVRAIFTHFGSSPCALSWTTPGHGILFARDLRWARNMAFLDAHEQLLLGPATSWVGDCMRREPGKSDAYECFALDCAETARTAEVSFERLWLASQPVVSHAVETAQSVSGQSAAATKLLAGPAMSDQAAGDGGPTAATRH